MLLEPVAGFATGVAAGFFATSFNTGLAAGFFTCTTGVGFATTVFLLATGASLTKVGGADGGVFRDWLFFYWCRHRLGDGSWLRRRWENRRRHDGFFFSFDYWMRSVSSWRLPDRFSCFGCSRNGPIIKRFIYKRCCLRLGFGHLFRHRVFIILHLAHGNGLFPALASIFRHYRPVWLGRG